MKLCIAIIVGILSLSLLNPPQSFAQAEIERDIGISVTIEGEVVELPQVLIGGSSGGVEVQQAKLAVKGYAYPDAGITVLKNRGVIATLLADKKGIFEKTITTDAGLATIGVWAKDASGRNSSTSSITIVLQPNTKTTISDIVVSPTISADRNKIRQGKVLKISGSTFPKSLVRLFNNFAASQVLAPVKADQNGLWAYILETKELQFGEYSLRTNSQLQDVGLLSTFSDNLNFEIAEGGNIADLNGDNKVDIVDLSILLYNWHKQVTQNHPADLNGDKTIDLNDFSILMYNWNDENRNVA